MTRAADNPVGFLLALAFFVAAIWANVRIVQKAGYSGWAFLLALIPFINIVALFVFAFRPWPIERRLAELESQIR